MPARRVSRRPPLRVRSRRRTDAGGDVKLAPEAPWHGVPERVGNLRLAQVPLGHAPEILPLGNVDVSRALEETLGLTFPEPGRSAAEGGVRVIWFGRQSALVLGAAIDVEGAVCVDQSDAWAALELSGTVREVLARLCPLDLRDRSFAVDATARTLLHHVGISLTRVSQDHWLLLVPRTMTGSVLTAVTDAATGLAAR